MTKVEELIDELDTLGVKLDLKDGKINFTPKSKVTPEMLSRMKDHRDELIAYLLEGKANGLESQKAIVGNEGPKDGPQGLGGWLIILGIGVVFQPIKTFNFSRHVFLPLFSDGTWAALTTPGSEFYDPMWAPLLIFEILVNIGFIIFYVLSAVLFFRKSQWFPKLWIAITVFNVFFVILDAWLASFVIIDEPMLDPETMQELTQTLFYGAIWIPYLIVSKRVKNTFVK